MSLPYLGNTSSTTITDDTLRLGALKKFLTGL